jgi:MFS family permease
METSKIGTYGWKYYHTVWVVLIFAWISNYLVRVGLSPVLIPIMQEFQLTYAQAGLLATAFFFAYTVMQLPAGILGDRVGKKRILALAPVWWGLMSLATSLAPTFSALFLVRFLTGVGQGTYFGNDRPVIAAVTPEKKMALGQGVSFMGLGIGMAIGVYLAGIIADVWGWRAVFLVFAFPSLLAGFLVWRRIQEPPSRPATMLPWRMWLILMPFPIFLMVGLVSDWPVVRWASLLFPAAFLLRVLRREPALRSWDLWCVFCGGIAPIYCLWVVGIWMPAIFLEIGVSELSRSALLSSLLGVSAIPGLLCAGVVSDRLAKRERGRKAFAGLILLGLALVMFLMGMAVARKAAPAVLAGLVVLAGLCIWGVWAPVFAMLAELTPQRIQGTVFGMNNTINFIGSLAAPVATGWVRDTSGSFAGACFLAGLIGMGGAAIMLCVRPIFRWGREARATEPELSP